MEYTTHPHPTDGGIYMRFPTRLGTIWVRVIKEDHDVASVTVMEQDSAMAAAWMSDGEAYALPVVQEQRNRFGTGLMLKILRAVRDSMPSVVTWAYERKSGINPGIRAKKGAVDAV